MHEIVYLLIVYLVPESTWDFVQFTLHHYMFLRLFLRGPSTIKSYSTMTRAHIKVAANDFLDFVNASPTPFHAVKSVKERLSKVGFKEIKV